MSTIETRLTELGVTLPDAPAPAANYVPYVIAGDMVYVSGQVPIGPEGLIAGKLGEDMSVEDGAAAAKVCAISLLAQLKAACGGDIDRLVRVVKLVGFVNSTADFGDQPKVITVTGVDDARGRSPFAGADALCGQRGQPALWCGSRNRGHLPDRMTLPDSFLTIPLAHRALHDRKAGRVENSRKSIQAEPIAATIGPIEVTASLGVTSPEPVDLATPEELIAEADDRLTEARRAGGDRTVC